MKRHSESFSLQQWLWKTFRRHALVPILFVESTLLVAYVATAYTNSSEINDELRRVARVELEQVAARETKLLEHQLSSVTAHLKTYADTLNLAFDNKSEEPIGGELQEFMRGEKGQLYSTYDSGNEHRAAFFYSGVTPPAEQDLDKVRALNTTETIMRSITSYNELIQQIYFNSADSLNHIYPPFDVNEQYAGNIEIPNFNFYFLANQRYNPEKNHVWTDLYLDPAGSGWMLSNIIPIYTGEHLEGVAGVDITVSGLIDRINSANIPWNGFALLLGPDNQILALPSLGQSMLGLSIDTTTKKKKITNNVFADKQFSFAQVPGANILLKSLISEVTGTSDAKLNNNEFIVSWQKLDMTNWLVVTAIPKAELYAGADKIKQSTQAVTWALLLSLTTFYAVYFFYIKNRTTKISKELLMPVKQLQWQVSHVGSLSDLTSVNPSRILEFNEIQNHVIQISLSLDKTFKQLKASQTRLQSALEGGSDALITVYEKSHLVIVSKEFNRFLGSSHNEKMTVAEYDKLIHPDDIQDVHRSRQHGLKHGERIQIDYRLKHANGSYIWVQSRGQRIESDEFDGFALAGTISDISARKEVERVLLNAKDAAERESQAKTKLLSSVTHELRTPLTSILGITEILKIKMTDSKLKSYTNQIELSALALSALIDDLLIQTQLESGMLKINARPVDAKKWLLDTIKLSKQESHEHSKRIILGNHSAIDDSKIHIDPSRAKQVIDNIISNALKYSPSNKPVHVRAYTEGHYLFISIIDYGQGIPEHLKDFLFQRFERLGRESGNIAGTGLGLSICKELIALMGGCITYTKEEFAGSNFTIRFNLYEEKS